MRWNLLALTFFCKYAGSVFNGEVGNIHYEEVINDTETYKHGLALFTQQGKSINAHLNCCIQGGGGKCTELLVPVFVEAIIHLKISNDNVIDIMTCPKYTSILYIRCICCKLYYKK